MHNHKFSTVN